MNPKLNHTIMDNILENYMELNKIDQFTPNQKIQAIWSLASKRKNDFSAQSISKEANILLSEGHIELNETPLHFT